MMDGVHLFNKSNSDVRGILFERQAMQFLVQGASAFFSNIENFAVTHSGLVYVKKSDFRHTKKLKTLALNDNEITRIPADAFDELTKLEILILSFNRIKSLPVNLLRSLEVLKILHLNNNDIEEINHVSLKYNLCLEVIWFQHNKIHTIVMKVDGPLPRLRYANYQDNKCIDKKYENISQSMTDVFLDDIRNCSSQCEQKLLDVAECNENLFELEKEIENLTKEILKIRNVQRSKLII